MTIAPRDPLLRIYAPGRHGTGPDRFRRFGPLARFDHHRAPFAAPADDDGRAVLYAGRSLVCCVAEVFGDVGLVQSDGFRFARLACTRRLRLLDLRAAAATAAGTIPAIGAVGERDVTQAWSRWWHEQAELTAVDGLLSTSAQCGEDAITLWERAEGALRVVRDLPLDAPELFDELTVAAHAVRLAVV